MELYNPAWNQVDGQKGFAAGWIRIPGLIPPKNVDLKERFKTKNALDAVYRASQSIILRKGPSQELKNLQRELDRVMRKTLAEISAEVHSRLVFGIGCVPMILIGIGIGIIKRGGHLLSAFAISCVPAMLLIVAIISGKNVTENLGSQSISGIVLMWAGPVFLSILTVAIFQKLLRN
jgi:hypothetical protein